MKIHSKSSFSKLMSLGNELRHLPSSAFLPEALQNLSATQMSTIIYISDYEDDEIFQKDIENFLRIRRSSVSSLLNNLEKRKLIVRTPVPEDARLKKVTLTEMGNELCRSIEEFHEEIERFMKTVLNVQEWEIFEQILTKLITHIKLDQTLQPQKTQGAAKSLTCG